MRFRKSFPALIAMPPLLLVVAIYCVLIAPHSGFAEDTAALVEEPSITDFDRDHWSFKPIEHPEIPAVETTQAVRNAIDNFVTARLESADLTPLPEASGTTLLRRLKFDLLGLPPTPAEVRRFTQGLSDADYERLVDRLLGSPRYGERWAQHWLDLARFAETDGFEHDKVRPNAWKYRDWVINALNEDMPYDRFLRLQIAGDQLEPTSTDARVATAFCLSGPDMPDINSQDERRHNLLNELTATVGSVVMGLQLGCAQCHDHKYDPISQADFYRMRAFFDPAVSVKRNESVFALTKIDPKVKSYVMLRGDHRRPGPPIEPGFVRVAHTPATSSVERQSSATSRADLANWLTRATHPLTARVIVNRIWQQHFGRGLTSSSSDFGVMGTEPTHPKLLDFLASELPRHGWSLKWLHRQIVTSATYRRASRDSEPHWDAATRGLAAEILQRANSEDPTNELLGRFPRRRLEGEVVRDAMLCLSDRLNEQTSGPGVRPPLPPELLKTLLKNQWKATPDASQHDRRSIYVFARRNLRYPIFDVFDRPDGNASCACRDESTTATQSLLMLNSESSLATARKLAALCLRQRDGEAAIGLAIERCFGRVATEAELELLTKAMQYEGEDEANSMTQICLALLNANEFLYID